MNEAKPSASPRRKLSESGYLKIDIPKCQFNFVKRQHERVKDVFIIEHRSVLKDLWNCTSVSTLNNNFALIKTVTVFNTDAIARKISILQKLDHENVVRLLDVVKDVEFNLTTYTMIFDNVDTTSLSDAIQRHTLNSVLMKKYLYQILHGVSYLHSLGIILRDLQPAYLLINSMRQIVKIANLVLVKKYVVSACDNFDKFIYTKYLAPELILQLQNYSNAVDMWSVGCIFAEMVLRKPLFSGEFDVMIDIFRCYIIKLTH
ncbi:hypothetical protein LWI28_000625 [Acer negundo]|uniref:cyclin-dependent kinase n=1 Tax=Acer negundo TaxID=4023 RepID=A0AAD5NGJ3_ACENE|nr:hypothetical protein LWI28_000625 [Acer negundo]